MASTPDTASADASPTEAASIFYRRRFVILLSAELLLTVVFPLLRGALRSPIVPSLLISVLLLATIFAVSRQRIHFWIAVVLATSAFLVIWINNATPLKWLQILAYVIEFVFFAYTTAIILSDVLRRGRVTIDKLTGAVSVYLLIGVTWAMLFGLIDSIQPGSFEFRVSSSEGSSDAQSFPRLLYYSYVTLSTLGYGDITPLSRAAQTFSWLEALVGQLFLAVLVARLVGLYIAHESQQPTNATISDG